MPEPKKPTWRARWLGEQLRLLRKNKGFKAAEVGKRINGSASTITRIESGEYPARNHELTALMDLYGVAEEDVRARYQRLSRDVALRGWWESVMTDRDFSDFVWAENNARTLSSFQLAVIPGLLQTRDYAENLIRSGPHNLSESRVLELLEARLARAEILTNANPPNLRFIIHEAVLEQRMREVSIAIHVEQIEHLRAVSKHRNIGVRIFPSSEVTHNSLGITTGYTLVNVRDWPTIAHVETPIGPVIAETPEVDNLVTNYETLWSKAKSETESAKQLEAKIKEMQT